MKTTLLIVAITVTLMAAFLQVIDCQKNRKGVCFMKYSKKTGCRKLKNFGGKKVSFDDCCNKKGAGWSVKRKNRKKCTPCVVMEVATSYWANWGAWTECSATCGESYKQRKRECISNGKPNCPGKPIEKKKCKKVPCPVDGGWTAWSKWGPCSVTCGKGYKVQKRSCSNPKPDHGGKECQGKLEKWMECELQKHCPIDGGWGEWSAWGACSKTCDLGIKIRTRNCDSPKPKYGGMPCNVSEAIGKDYCREERCGETSEGCDESSENCASGSGSGWEVSSGSGSSTSTTPSGSGSGSGSGSVLGSGFGYGEGSSGKNNRSWVRKPKIPDDEDFS